VPKYNYLIDKIELVQSFFLQKYVVSKSCLSERLNIGLLGLETLNRRHVIFDLILYYTYVHGLVEINNCNFIRIHQPPETRGNGMKLYKEQCNIVVRHQIGTLYLQQSSLTPVRLFLNEIYSQVDVQQLFTLHLIICLYVCLLQA